MIRHFELVKHRKGLNENEWKPVRTTKGSAGYDFMAVEDVELPSIFKLVFDALKGLATFNLDAVSDAIKPVLVPTGVKVIMQRDEVLKIYNRSSNAVKRGIFMPNTGIIDSDYANNPDNDGEIFFQFWNFGLSSYTIHKGDRIGQGIFQKFLVVDDDQADGKRTGGHGSTGR